MGPLKQKTITVNTDIATTIAAARQVISQYGWKVSFMDSNSIKASTGISIWGWGETITIQTNGTGNTTYLNIQSKSAWALVDFGKNQENINKFLMKLSKFLFSFT